MEGRRHARAGDVLVLLQVPGRVEELIGFASLAHAFVGEVPERVASGRDNIRVAQLIPGSVEIRMGQWIAAPISGELGQCVAARQRIGIVRAKECRIEPKARLVTVAFANQQIMQQRFSGTALELVLVAIPVGIEQRVDNAWAVVGEGPFRKLQVRARNPPGGLPVPRAIDNA